MNGNNIFLDTNIILYLISGDENLADLLNNKTIYLSFITELEILGYKEITTEEIKKVAEFLASVTIIDTNSEIKKITTGIRRNYLLHLYHNHVWRSIYDVKMKSRDISINNHNLYT